MKAVLYLNSMNPNGYCRKRIENYSYNLEDQVGKGFSSFVYRGTNDSTGQSVAIKVINLKQVKDGLAKLMLDNEVECLRQFNHPNLLRFQTTLSTLNNYYIITQFCQGDLAQKLKAKGKFTQQEFIPIFKDVFSGYRMLYCYGYVHRDLKPANLLIKGNTIKIADFGFVKKSLTGLRCQQSYNVGTPIYMSPESMKYNIYTYKSDIWSMGVMFYQLLTGTTPWNCRNEKELREKIQGGKVDFSQLDASEELKDLIRRCLQKEENKRISVGEIERQAWVQKIMGESTQKKAPKQNPELIEDQKQTPLNSLEVLKSYLNFGRFIYRILNYLPGANLPPSLLSKIDEELSTNLLYCVNFHKEIIVTGNNLISFPDWAEFINSPSWASYKQVVLSYIAKYQNKISSMVPLYYNKQILLKFIKQILALHQTTKQTAICLDLLVSYFQLIQLLERVSWDYGKFCKYSQIDCIMQGMVNEKLDKESLLQSVKWKLYRMGILN